VEVRNSVCPYGQAGTQVLVAFRSSLGPSDARPIYAKGEVGSCDTAPLTYATWPAVESPSAVDPDPEKGSTVSAALSLTAGQKLLVQRGSAAACVAYYYSEDQASASSVSLTGVSSGWPAFGADGSTLASVCA
jgi:hypothetical protein